MITLKEYLMGRDELYPQDWTPELYGNAVDLIKRVNNLLADLKRKFVDVSSGWRPPEINKRAGGAPRSAHLLARAVDLKDSDGSLAKEILAKPDLLTNYGLWLEDPLHTVGWVHLDTIKRTERFPHVFKP